MYSGPPSVVRPLIPFHVSDVTRYLTVLSGKISTKLGTNIHRVSWHCWKGFQGQRSRL